MHRYKIKLGIVILGLTIIGQIQGQIMKGMVLSSTTESSISYVNIGIIGKNIGTVTDDSGNYSLNLDNANDGDSIRISMIEYNSKTFQVKDFRVDSSKTVFLNPKSYYLPEVNVKYRKSKTIKLGVPIIASTVTSGFAYNNLGAEMGINVFLDKPVWLLDINLNVAICTFDSVKYRLNIYQLNDSAEYVNILTKPIYIVFTKDKISNAVNFDLRKYLIKITGDVLITLEQIKDLGEGSLQFHTNQKISSTYFRKTSQGDWNKAPGVIGLSLTGQKLN